MNIGMIAVSDMIAIVEPIRVSFIAWCPLPSRRSSWPGRVARHESSSGAPRKMDGMKSRKVWVIAVAVMKIRRVWIGRDAVRVIMNIAIRLMWIPGIRPVRVPVRVPRIRGIMKFNIGGQCCLWF